MNPPIPVPPGSSLLALTLRSQRTYLTLQTSDGPIEVRLRRVSAQRAQIVLVAPRSVQIHRETELHAPEGSEAKEAIP